jgi:hypothetical protein
MSVPRMSARRASVLIRQFIEAPPVICSSTASSALISRHDLIVEDDFKRVFDAVCAVDEHKQGSVLPSEVSEVFRLLGCQDDPSAVKRCAVQESTGRIDLVQVLRIFFPSSPPSSLEKLMPLWARPTLPFAAAGGNASTLPPKRQTQTGTDSPSSRAAHTLLTMLDGTEQRGYTTLEELQGSCHAIDRQMLADMVVCCSDEAASRRAQDMEVFRTKRLVDLFVRAKLPAALASVRTTPYLTLFSLGPSWSAVRGTLIAALPSMSHQTRLAALAVFVHRYGPLAAFKVQWPADLDAPVPFYSVAVDMCTAMDLSQRSALDPHNLRIGPSQLEKLLFFSSAKDAHALLGLHFFAGASGGPVVSAVTDAVVNGTTSVAELLATGQLLAAATAVSSAPSSGSATTADASVAHHEQQYFQVRHTLALPKPNFLVRRKETRIDDRPVTPPAQDIPESEWQSILAENNAAAVPRIDIQRLNVERKEARTVRSADAGRRWRSQRDQDAAARRSYTSEAERTIETILTLGVNTAGRTFVQSLHDEARLTYCSNVRHVTSESVVVEPTPHTPRPPRVMSARPRQGISADVLHQPPQASSNSPRVVTMTPRIGSGLASHRPVKRPAVAAMRSLWSKKTWSYEAGGSGAVTE